MPRTILWGLVLSAATVLPGGCDAARAADGPPPNRLATNAACIDCHEREAREWSGSLHNNAWTDASFAHAYANEPSPFCWGCHAPESTRGITPADSAAQVGVTCVSCHLAPGSPQTRPVREHPEVVRADALVSQTCGRCHEFGFETQPSLSMQSTLTEHQTSAYTSESCASCHMPEGSHAFGITRDRERLSAALSVDAERVGSIVRLRLRSRGVGHAFPTGDTFRALHVEVGREGQPASDDRRLHRTFTLERARSGLGFVLEEVDDTRLSADGSTTEVELSVPAANSDTLWWRVVYERRDNPFKSDAKTFERIALAEGTLNPVELQR